MILKYCSHEKDIPSCDMHRRQNIIRILRNVKWRESSTPGRSHRFIIYVQVTRKFKINVYKNDNIDQAYL